MRRPSSTRQTLQVSSALALDEEAAVGAEGHVVDGARVPFQRAQGLAGDRVPELDRLVIAAGGQPIAVGREFGVVEEVAVALEPPDERAVARRSRSPRRRPGPRRPRPSPAAGRRG